MPYPAISRPANHVAGKYHKTPKNLPSLGGRGERGGGMVRQAHHECILSMSKDHPSPSQRLSEPAAAAGYFTWDLVLGI